MKEYINYLSGIPEKYKTIKRVDNYRYSNLRYFEYEIENYHYYEFLKLDNRVKFLVKYGRYKEIEIFLERNYLLNSCMKILIEAVLGFGNYKVFKYIESKYQKIDLAKYEYVYLTSKSAIDLCFSVFGRLTTETINYVTYNYSTDELKKFIEFDFSKNQLIMWNKINIEIILWNKDRYSLYIPFLLENINYLSRNIKKGILTRIIAHNDTEAFRQFLLKCRDDPDDFIAKISSYLLIYKADDLLKYLIKNFQ